MGILEIQVKKYSNWIYSLYSLSGPCLTFWGVFTISLFFPTELGGI